MDDRALLRELLAKQACTELVYKVARAIDRCDEALLRAAFHADATDDHGLFKGAALEFIAWVLPMLAKMKRTQHCICNVLIEIDGARAAGESYFTAYHVLDRGDGQDVFMIAAGRYLDRFEQRDGVWRIAHRSAIYDWNAQSPSTDAWDRTTLGGWTFGARGTADASYAHFAG